MLDTQRLSATPLPPPNNVNYSPQESGLANTYSQHPATNENPFLRSIPAEDDHWIALLTRIGDL